MDAMARFTESLAHEITALVRQQQQRLSGALGESLDSIVPTNKAAQSPLKRDLTLLIQVANGEFARAQTSAATMQAVELALQRLLGLLLGNALHTNGSIPDSFWRTDIGVLVSRVRWWISVDDLITISNAAALAFGENSQANRMRITRAIDKGVLNWIPDPSMANPQQNKRVLRSQVERLREERQVPE